MKKETPNVDETLTRKVAELARLELSDAETTLFAGQLKEILEYVDLLKQADISDVPPLFHPLELGTPLREDVVQPSPVDAQGRPRVFESAPDVLHDGFKVPPVL